MSDQNDLRRVLSERLASIGDRKDYIWAEAQKKVDELADEELTTKKLLAIEERRLGPLDDVAIPKKAVQNLPPLSEFFESLTRDNPMSKEELRDWAESNGYENAGRSTHATLMNLTKAGRLQELPDGRYQAITMTRSKPFLTEHKLDLGGGTSK